MTTEGELLAAIAADPADNGARLVYGDWLLAQGDPRGELIVVQCRLAEGTANEKERKKLVATEKKLEKALARAWINPIRERLGYPESSMVDLSLRVDVERGFAVAVQAPADILLRLDDLFAVAPFVTELRIGSIPPFDELTRINARYFTSAHLSKIKSLTIGVPGAGDGVLRLIAGTPLLSSLETLRLSGSIYSLGQGGDRVTPEGLYALARAKHLRGLKELVLNENMLGNDGLAAIASAPWRLETLSVARNLFTTYDVFTNEAFSGLKRLDVRSNRASSPKQAALLGSAKSLRSLVALDIESCDLGFAGLKAFLEAFELPKLESLIAASNGFTEKGAELIAQSTKLQKLKVLDLTKNNFNKKGIQLLAAGPGLTGVGKVLLKERDSADAREAVSKLAATGMTKVYFRGKLVAKAK